MLKFSNHYVQDKITFCNCFIIYLVFILTDFTLLFIDSFFLCIVLPLIKNKLHTNLWFFFSIFSKCRSEFISTFLSFSINNLLGFTTPLATFLAHPEKAEPEAPIEAASNRMSYSRFLHHLEESEVKKVDLFENGTVAIGEISNPALRKIQRVRVNLPGLQEGVVWVASWSPLWVGSGAEEDGSD